MPVQRTGVDELGQGGLIDQWAMLIQNRAQAREFFYERYGNYCISDTQ